MLTRDAGHNDGVRSPGDQQSSRRVATLTALVLALGLSALAGCSEDDPDPGPDTSASSSTSSSTTPSASESESAASATPTESLPVPEGVELTAQGAQLEVGDTATVAYEPRQGLVGVLDITVTRLEKTSFKESFEGWDLDDGARKTKPYFVRATLVNRGVTNLGERRVPLYIVDGTNTLVEATSFASAFEPCNPGAFPKRFPTGKKVKVCLVYLSPRRGDLTAVSFRPTQEFDPILWTGELQAPKPPKKGKGKGGKGDGGQ